MHVATALVCTPCHTAKNHLMCLESDEVEPDDTTPRPPLRVSARIGPLAERRLEGETAARADYITDYAQDKVTWRAEQVPGARRRRL